MTKNRKIELARKFTRWLEKSGCIVKVTLDDRYAGLRIFDVVCPTEDGLPYNTLCYTTCYGENKSIEDCWVEILERRCAGELAIDRFDLIGLSKADTMEELELKLEIVDAG